MPSPAPRQPHAEIAQEGQACHHNNRPPQLVGIEGSAGSISLVGQQRQDNDGDQPELDHRIEFKPIDPRHKAVKPGFDGQEKGRDDSACRDRRHLPQNRGGAERKGQQKRDLGGQADVLIALYLHPVADGQQGAEGGQTHGEHDGGREG